MNLLWKPKAWQEYLYWQQTDKTIVKRINALIKDALRHPFDGIGKPEPLRWRADNAWSRRITEEHRLVYCVEGEDLIILQVRFHYQ